jgi:hypothetical protein
MEFSFKKNTLFRDRKSQCDKILQLYKNKIPIICEKDPICKLEPMDKTKFLVDEKFTVQNFLNLIRNKMKLLDTQALFIFFGDKKPTLATGDRYMRDVYENFKDSDGYLYAIYSSQEIWGK